MRSAISRENEMSAYINCPECWNDTLDVDTLVCTSEQCEMKRELAGERARADALGAQVQGQCELNVKLKKEIERLRGELETATETLVVVSEEFPDVRRAIILAAEKGK